MGGWWTRRVFGRWGSIDGGGWDVGVVVFWDVGFCTEELGFVRRTQDAKAREKSSEWTNDGRLGWNGLELGRVDGKFLLKHRTT